MDKNRNGRNVPNELCVICQEATEDVSYEEHAKHVDFIAARVLAHGYRTPAPPAEQWAAEYRGPAELLVSDDDERSDF